MPHAQHEKYVSEFNNTSPSPAEQYRHKYVAKETDAKGESVTAVVCNTFHATWRVSIGGPEERVFDREAPRRWIPVETAA